MTQDGEPFNQDELDEMLEIAIDPHTQTVPYEYYINKLMVCGFSLYFPITSQSKMSSMNRPGKKAFTI